MPLLRALLYLRLMTVRNIALSRLRRLKQPKYLIGFIAGAAYLWFIFLRRLGPGSPGSGPALAGIFHEGFVEFFAAAILSIFVLCIWVFPGEQPGLPFSEPEVAFLFAAPLSRQQLIHYKLLDGLVTSLLSALFFTVMSTGLRHGWVGAFRHFGAWWILNANLTLHQSVASFSISRLSALGLGSRMRRVLLLAGGAALVIGLLIFSFYADAQQLKFLLWPARLIVRPFLAPDVFTYALAMVPPLGLLVLQYFYVHRMESPFEEASIVRAQKTADTIARVRAGKSVRLGSGPAKARREPFRLGPRLPPEFALLWKNLMAAPSYLNRKVFVGAAVVIYVGVRWLQSQPGLGSNFALAFGVVALVLLGYLLVFGPQLARNDLRGDLLHADMLKAWPLPGWRVVLGSVLAPTMLLASIAWLLVFAAALAFYPGHGKVLWLTPQLRVAGVVAITVILPALCALQLLVPNAATMLFPAWAPTGRPATGGMDVMGQRMIFFIGQFLCLLLVLMPAIFTAWFTWFITQWVIGSAAAVLLAVVPVLGILALELWLGVHWIGLRFEVLDISAELRP